MLLKCPGIGKRVGSFRSADAMAKSLQGGESLRLRYSPYAARKWHAAGGSPTGLQQRLVALANAGGHHGNPCLDRWC